MEEITQSHEISTTFPRRERISKQGCEMGHAVHQSSNGVHRRRRSSIQKKLPRRQRNAKSQENGDEKGGIERRIMALQRIIPGGESLGIDKLFQETAGYILALQGQVKAMNVLASFFEELQKETRKLGE
ncbi:hypothetical protein HHK36_003539 [Tetracentron sinense]|uniref:Uncharacterized protein n=1 Tax=Tetracentron sinense TaxID=13715 RepID=A0A834ZSP8_TETSI|nr:hypothetical protein HHK36_003539 [Tetracentron sinense]